MNRIKYYYSAMSKQVFLILLCLFFIVRFALFAEIVIFDVQGYGDSFNIGGTFILYILYILICIFFFIAYKLFYTEYDENTAVYHNKLLKKQISADLSRLRKASLTKKGVFLYYDENSSEACLYIPFWRFGKISPVGIDDFYKLLKSKDIIIDKQFKVLPGYGKSKNLTSLIYSCLALLTLGSLTQSLALFVAILKNL